MLPMCLYRADFVPFSCPSASALLGQCTAVGQSLCSALLGLH